MAAVFSNALCIPFQVTLTTTDHSGKTALHYCVENESTKIAEMIVNADQSLLDKKDEEGYSPLQLAVIAGNSATIEYLLQKGADLHAKDNEGHTAIHWATGKYKHLI